MKRRDVLKAAGGLVVGFSLHETMPFLAAQSAGPGPRPLDPREVDSALVIHADGRVTVYTSKVDVGTGMRVAIAQMAAEELGVATSAVTVVDGDTSMCPNTGGTGGSTGLTRGGTAVRQAAATARQEIVRLASARIGAPADRLTIVDGVVRAERGGRGIGIGALLGGQRLRVTVDAKAPLVAPSAYTRVRRSPARPDVPAKCAGRHPYVQDFTVPGMLHARVLRPPALEATLVNVDTASVSHLPSVRVVRIENFLAVVAADEWTAVRAAGALKATWSEWRGLPRHDDLERYLRGGVVDRLQAIVNRGPGAAAPPSATPVPTDAPALEAALAGASRTFAATYFWPCQSHASLGPSSAVADISGDGGTVWNIVAVTYGLRNTLARLFALTAEKLRVVFVEGSGSYGPNGADHAAADAVLISKTVGRPVRVQWSRQDEHGWDPKGPQQLLDLRAGVDANGRIVAWDTQMWIPTNRRGARILLAAGAAGIPQDNGRDAAAIFENGEPPYTVDHVRVLAHWVRDTPLNTSNLRAPGKPANLFAVEGLTDEIAAALRRRCARVP